MTFGMAESFSERRGIDVAAGPPRHVVHDDRKRRAFGDGFVMLDESVRCGLVVVGRHGEQAIRARTLHLACGVNDLPGVVPACAGEHRHCAARFLHANLHDTGSLFFGERRALAGRAARNEKMNAFVDLAPRQPPDAILIQEQRRSERRHDRSTNAGKWCSHSDSVSG